jgi:PBP4 family serine-type D-alanyl-D-alanine carboxypeptidase
MKSLKFKFFVFFIFLESLSFGFVSQNEQKNFFEQNFKNFESLLSIIQKSEKQKINFRVELGSENNIFQYENHQSVMPASVLKLLTAYHALYRLGENFKFKTKVKGSLFIDKTNKKILTNLTLTNDGDPSWGLNELNEDITTRIDEIVLALKKDGVTSIQGEIILKSSDSRWDELKSSPLGWDSKDFIRCYGAYVQSFNLQRNCSGIAVFNDGSAAWVDSGITTKIVNELKKGSNDSISITRIENGYKLTGTVKVESKNKTTYKALFVVPVLDTKSWILNLFKNSLLKNGISLSKEIKASGQSVVEYEKIFESPPLYMILKPMLKNSINMVAEAVFLKLGEVYSQKKSLYESGIDAFYDFVENILKIKNHEGIVVLDGSGLSRMNRITANFLYSLLEKMIKSDHMTYLYDMLPIAGVDGTLKNRFKNTIAQNNFRAKTGTLNNVKNLAGFTLKKDKIGTSYLEPVVVLNFFEDESKMNQAVKAQERLVVEYMKIGAKDLLRQDVSIERSKHRQDVSIERSKHR